MSEEVKLWLASAVMGGGEALHPGGSEKNQSELGEDSSESREEELALAPLIRVGLLCRRQRPSTVIWGKWQASLSPKAGPSKSLGATHSFAAGDGQEKLASIKGVSVPMFAKGQSGREEVEKGGGSNNELEHSLVGPEHGTGSGEGA
ncbi:hypothetical protein C0993_001060 [Termitomyces sp. T159_Od127]|nr:hypothetical protein C0993_001060 [Termitomyces sp. T159_Od127]